MIEIRPSHGVSHHLTADHVRLDIIFGDARRLAAHDLPAARAAFADFAAGLERHIRVEEELLFPPFDARGAMSGPTRVMTHEHRRIQQLLEVGRAALASGDANGFAGAADELGALLEEHNLKEERILYPRSDGILSLEECAAVVAALARS